MKGIKLGAFILIGTFLFSTSGFAKGFEGKIAYVDLSKIFDEYKKTKEYDAVLAKQSKAFQDERQKMIDKVRDDQNKLALLKDEEKKKLQDELDKKKQQLLEYDRQQRTDLTKTRDEKIREVLQEIAIFRTRGILGRRRISRRSALVYESRFDDQRGP